MATSTYVDHRAIGRYKNLFQNPCEPDYVSFPFFFDLDLTDRELLNVIRWTRENIGPYIDGNGHRWFISDQFIFSGRDKNSYTFYFKDEEDYAIVKLVWL